MGERLKSYWGGYVSHPRLVIMLSLIAIGFVGFVFGWTMNREGHEPHRAAAGVPRMVSE